MEELANLELTSSIIGVRAYGETEKELGEILEKLQENDEIEAYGQTGNTTITGITFGTAVEQNGIELEIGVEKAVEKTATFTSSDPSQDYYVQIRGKKYPIAKTNGVIKITKTEITTGTNASGIITNVYSDQENYAIVEKVSGTTDKIKIIGVAKGEATITVEYTENIKTSFIVRVKGNVTLSTQVENISDSENVGTATTITNALYAEGSEITLTVTVTNDDYQFVGWYETKDGGAETQKSTSASYTYTVPNDGTAVIVLKAKFQKKPEPLIGYYIKKENEYAIVFADRLEQAESTVRYDGYACTFPEITDDEKSKFKTYVISNETYTDSKFGTHNVIKLAEDNTGTEERFMALALNNFGYYSWYYSAFQKFSPGPTSSEFLMGKTNTEMMIEKWDAEAYGSKDGGGKNLKDVWGPIKAKVSKGWFMPSYKEWVAFGYAMKEGKLRDGANDYNSLGLAGRYWSSTTGSSTWNKYIRFDNFISTGCGRLKDGECARLATTF